MGAASQLTRANDGPIPPKPGTRVLIIVNIPAFFLSHRLPIARAAAAAGYEVHVATGPGKGAAEIEAQGFRHHNLALSRTGTNPFAELAGFMSILAMLHRLRPHVLHVVTIKPVLYGGIASRLAPVAGVVAAISGLGSMFAGDRNRAGRFRSRALGWAYRAALGKRVLRVVFQNMQDRQVLMDLTHLPLSKTRLLRGSGVDLAQFVPVPELPGPPIMLFASRLLLNKGVGEFIQAARILRQRGVDGRFWIAGALDAPSPDVISAAELHAAADENIVTLLGHRRDMPQLLNHVHAMVLPSYYGEGIPKVLLEAAACGRPVITTDHPGCRDAITPGETGLLVPVRDAEALADAMQKLIEDDELRLRMGQAGRQLAEAEFSDAAVARAHLEFYAELLADRA